MRLFTDVASGVEDPYLRHALALALRAEGATAPNPLVGCVIVRDRRIVGQGFHPRAGEPHAEVFALADAGDEARGAVAYVTLEPCAHHGRTPPCTEALIAAGVSRLVVGMRDPNPEARGGEARLREAGIEIVFADDPSPFVDINEGWLKRTATGMPLTTVKLALSLDGHGALFAGERAAITGASGAQVTRLLRKRADAVLVGAGTVIADDSRLTVRDSDGTLAEHQPIRIVLVRDRAPRPDAAVFTDGAAPTLVLASDATPDEALAGLPGSVLVERFSASEGVLGALKVLGARGVGELLIEAGPGLFSALWEQHLVDSLVTVTAGGMAGGMAPALFTGAPDHDGNELRHPAVPVEAGIVGDVSVTVWRPAPGTDVI